MGHNKIRIIGIDPGLATTGIAILDVAGSKYLPIFCGCIITIKNKKIHLRLKEIYNGINKIILDYSPDCLAIEDIFFSINVKTALNVGQARGISILACSENNIKIFEYTPLQVKEAIVGYGRATKLQIKYMLKAILGVEDNFFPKEDDAWDAMAIAICHANNYKFENKIKELVE